jgi:hypothetical protein
MLRLFLAWRLLRMLFPLLLFAFAALALTTAFRVAPHTARPEHSSLAHAARQVQLAVKPLVSDLSNALTRALAPSGH